MLRRIGFTREDLRELRSQLTPVFYVGAVLALAFVLWGVLGKESMASATAAALGFVVADFGWLYLIATTAFLAFVIYLAISRFGRVRLGRDDERPEFSRFSWFAMLFQAGMGIGLVFWAVAEPLSHFSEPPYGMAQPGSVPAANLAIEYSFFHWSLHPWGVYAAIALAIAYFNFRRGEPGLVSAALRPLIGDRVDGPIGKAVDVLAIIATLFGVAVSLGLGALQITSGLAYLFGIPNTAGVQITVIAITAVLFLASASTGVGRGVKWLSSASIVVAGVLLLFVFVMGPSVLQLNTLTQATGGYLAGLLPMSFRMNAFAGDPWLAEWTLFYWATWIAWAPYVGSFIARVSRGRTVREFVVAVLVVPSLVSFVWFAAFGATAIDLDRTLGGVLSRAVSGDEAVGLFVFFEQFPLALATSIVAIFLVLIFFVAGADAASIVLGRMSAGGVLNPKTPIKLVWGVVMGAIAAVLLLAGGLDALQQASILAAAPFAVIILLMCAALWKAISSERPASPAGAAEEESGDASGHPSRQFAPAGEG